MEGIDIIIIWAMTCISLGMGILIGRHLPTATTPAEKEKETKKTNNATTLQEGGLLMRPTQQQILENQNPTVQEGKKEFKTLLDRIVEE